MLISSYSSVKGNRGKAVGKCLQGEMSMMNSEPKTCMSAWPNTRDDDRKTQSLRAHHRSHSSVFGFKAFAKNTLSNACYLMYTES